MLPVPAHAEALSCPPLQPAVGAAAQSIPHGQGLLWRLERGSARPSYLFGTIHVSDPRVVDIPAPVAAALRASHRFVMEALFDPTSVVGFAEAMVYPDGTKLEDKTGRALYERTQQLLARFNIPPLAAQALRPWAAFMTLNQPEGDVGVPLDLVLMQRAQEQGLPIDGLETLREQAEVLAAFSEREQVVLLRDTVCYFDIIQSEIVELLERYLARDLAGIVALTGRYEGSDPALGDRMIAALIDARNVRMVERMQPMLEEGGAFIAIGALHLPGSWACSPCSNGRGSGLRACTRVCGH